MISRRTLLFTTAPAALALAGCATSGGTTTFNVAAFAQAIQAVSDELGAVLSALPTGTIAASTLSTIHTIIASIQTVATGVSSVVTPAAGANLLTTIEGYINELAPIVLPLLSAIPGIGPAAGILGIVVAALPAIEAMVGMVTALFPQTQTLASAAPAVPTTSGRLRAGFGTNSQYYLNLLVHRASGRLHSRYR